MSLPRSKKQKNSFLSLPFRTLIEPVVNVPDNDSSETVSKEDTTDRKQKIPGVCVHNSKELSCRQFTNKPSERDKVLNLNQTKRPNSGTMHELISRKKIKATSPEEMKSLSNLIAGDPFSVHGSKEFIMIKSLVRMIYRKLIVEAEEKGIGVNKKTTAKKQKIPCISVHDSKKFSCRQFTSTLSFFNEKSFFDDDDFKKGNTEAIEHFIVEVLKTSLLPRVKNSKNCRYISKCLLLKRYGWSKCLVRKRFLLQCFKMIKSLVRMIYRKLIVEAEEKGIDGNDKKYPHFYALRNFFRKLTEELGISKDASIKVSKGFAASVLNKMIEYTNAEDMRTFFDDSSISFPTFLEDFQKHDLTLLSYEEKIGKIIVNDTSFQMDESSKAHGDLEYKTLERIIETHLKPSERDKVLNLNQTKRPNSETINVLISRKKY
jgi:hypothetical protein